MGIQKFDRPLLGDSIEVTLSSCDMPCVEDVLYQTSGLYVWILLPVAPLAHWVSARLHVMLVADSNVNPSHFS